MVMAMPSARCSLDSRYLINSFAHFLLPATGAALFNAGILVPCFAAELSLTLWLLVKGVNVAQWDGRFCQDVTAR